MARVTHASAGRRGRSKPSACGEAAWRRHAESRRTNKGEQLEQIERRKDRDVEPPRGSARAWHSIGVLALDPAARLGRRQRFDLAVRTEPQHLAEASDEHRRLRHQDPLERNFAQLPPDMNL